jgi:hypothetical protein
MKPLVIIIFISLMLFSCGISHQIISLPKNRYKIQITGKNSLGKPTQDLDSFFRKKAHETCKGYKIVSVDSAMPPDKKYTTKTWIIECPDEKSAEEPKGTVPAQPKEERTAPIRPKEERTALTQPEPEWSYRGGLAIIVKNYEVVQKCRGYGEGPAKGSKLVYVWVTIRNVSDDIVELPSFFLELEGLKESSKSFGGKVCRYDEKALGNACWEWHGKLDPGVICEGWELFEVPERMQIEGRHVKVSVSSFGKTAYEVGRWRLEGN